MYTQANNILVYFVIINKCTNSCNIMYDYLTSLTEMTNNNVT